MMLCLQQFEKNENGKENLIFIHFWQSERKNVKSKEKKTGTFYDDLVPESFGDEQFFRNVKIDKKGRKSKKISRKSS